MDLVDSFLDNNLDSLQGTGLDQNGHPRLNPRVDDHLVPVGKEFEFSDTVQVFDEPFLNFRFLGQVERDDVGKAENVGVEPVRDLQENIADKHRNRRDDFATVVDPHLPDQGKIRTDTPVGELLRELFLGSRTKVGESPKSLFLRNDERLGIGRGRRNSDFFFQGVESRLTRIVFSLY